VVGLDHWYTAFGVLDIARASAEMPLVGFAEADAARARYAREKHPDVFATGDYEELIARPDVAVVAICAPTSDAPAIARAAIARGKHVLSVKPPALTVAELDDVLVKADRAGVFFGSFEGVQRLSDRALVLRDLLQSGAIGTPMSFHQIGHGGLPSPWPGETGPSWWTNGTKVPGGAWLDHAIYAVDLARFVLDGEVTQTMGIIENRVHTDLSVEDYGATLMRLASNKGGPSVSLFFEDTWTAEPGGAFSQTLFVGTAGTVRSGNSAWIVTQNGIETAHAIPPAPYFRLDRLAALLAGPKTDWTFGPADARANLTACLAAYGARGKG